MADELTKLMFGDCLARMAELPAGSVDAVVCDPPYELNFMGKGWDNAGVAFSVKTWEGVLRVLKPGGMLLAFGGTRTYHRMTCAIEDAGFEIRDCIQWLYGSGFPKSLDVGKAIDKAAGAERPITGVNPRAKQQTGQQGTVALRGDRTPHTHLTGPATDEAEQWDGWGTALKPANEPIVVARKPLGEKTVAGNVLRHGTGALNIGATRIGTTKDVPASVSRGRGDGHHAYEGSVDGSLRNETGDGSGHDPNVGRWPANVILDEEAAEVLDGQTGHLHSPGKPQPAQDRWRPESSPFEASSYAHGGGGKRVDGSSGGASRFFYVAKVAKSERNAAGPNAHPTVKPVALMRYLVRLVTQPGGVVLDPFMGSGTTGVACLREGFRFVGVEKDLGYFKVAVRRVADAKTES